MVTSPGNSTVPPVSVVILPKLIVPAKLVVPDVLMLKANPPLAPPLSAMLPAAVLVSVVSLPSVTPPP